MKCRCKERDCRTVESAIQVVERYESILGEGGEKKRSNIRALNNFSNFGPSTDRPESIRNNKKPQFRDVTSPAVYRFYAEAGP